MDPLTIALLTSAAVKAGTGMYSKHKQGQAMEKAQETQEDEQRRLDAIAQLQRRPSQQAALSYKKPKDAQIAELVGRFSDLGAKAAQMKMAGGGGPPAAGGQGLAGGVVDPNTLMKPANAYTSGFGQRRAIDTWQPSYLR